MNSLASRALFTATAIAGTAFAQLAANTASAADLKGSACDIATIAAPTHFPDSAQRTGEHGIVKARIHIDSQGLIKDADVATSSGFAALDNAAIESIRKYWRFAVANCSAADLDQARIVTVRYERSTYPTLSNTVSRSAVARIKELRNDARCSANAADSETTVFSCIGELAQENAIARASKEAQAK
jgi:TonB family protein